MKPYPDLFPNLFSPITIRNISFKNRIMAAPQGGFIWTDMDNNLNTDGIVFYGNKARSGAGYVATPEVYVDHNQGVAHNNMIFFHGERSLISQYQLVDYIHRYGAVAALEINDAGQWALPQYNGGKNPIGPSAKVLPSGVQVDEMTEDQMYALCEKYAEAASLGVRAGFDVMCLHAGHGWLLNQFLSPVENMRKDKYGGSLENRVRFPKMIIEAVRQAIGENKLIELRISTEEQMPGGITKDDSVEILRMLEDNVDIVDCSIGSRRNILSRAYIHPIRFMPHGVNAHLAEHIKKSGVNVAVMAVGLIEDPKKADELIAEGKADFVGMVRALVADPDWAEKARSGRVEDIRPCIRCNRCGDINAGRGGVAKIITQDKKAQRKVVCVVNPSYGNWHMLNNYFENVAEPRNIAIIGGGPAGMQAALTASESGHKVTLYEASGELGGLLKYSNGVYFKTYLNRYLQWLIRQVNKADITIKLNTKVTPQNLAGDYDAIIVAVGSEAITPNIPGIDGKNVMKALEAYDHPEKVGKNVVIVGGGSIGVEEALHLTHLGRKVTVVEMGEFLAKDLTLTERTFTMHVFEEEGCVGLTETVCTAITDEGVMIRNAQGERLLPADTVIIAVGMKAKSQEAHSFDKLAYDVIQVGDCVKAATLMEATRTAFDAIVRLNTTNYTPWSENRKKRYY